MSSTDDTVRGPAITGEVVLPAAAHAYLHRAATSLREAIVAADAPTKYACSHVSALQAAAALLSVRATPVASGGRRTRNAWVLLAQAAPEFESWATHFAGAAATYQAARAGSRRAVSPVAAEGAVMDADRFLAEVEAELGLLPHELLAAKEAGVA